LFGSLSESAPFYRGRKLTARWQVRATLQTTTLQEVVMVNVYESSRAAEEAWDDDSTHPKIVARVKYNEDLDQLWDGCNFTSGNVGMHKGIAQLPDGRFVIIIGSQWIGSSPYAYLVTPAEALHEILENRREELLEVFPSLLEIYKEKYIPLSPLLKYLVTGEKEFTKEA